MTAAPFRLLLLEDNAGDARLVQVALAEHAPGEYAVTWVERLADALARIASEHFDAALCDLGLPDSTGLATAQAIAARAPALPLVVLTGSHDEDLGREAIRQGAQDYVIKGEASGRMVARTLRYAIERKRLEIGIRVANESLARRVAERTAELDAAIKKLGTSETRFRELTELTSDWYWEQDEHFRFKWFSDGAMRHMGANVAEFLGKTRRELPIDQVTEEQWAEYRRQTEAQLPFRDFQYRWTNRDGEQYYFNISGRPVFDEQGQFRGYHGVGSDITKRKQAELALARQKDLYNALSQTNQAIVRGTGREELFQAVCRIAVEHGHFRFAWIGLIDKNDKRVRPVALYGEDAGYVKQLDISMDETVPAGAGRTGRALRTGRRVVSNDFGDERAQAPSRNRDAAQRAGVRAYGAFPIRQGGVVAGVINFYSTESGFFTEDLIATLEEMALDVSFALDNFEREAERARAVDALRESEARFRRLTEMSSDFYWESDVEHRFTQGNSAANLSVLSVWRMQIGKRRWETPYLSPDEAGWQAHRAMLEAHQPFREFELSRLGTDGTEHHLSVSGDPVFDASGAFTGYHGVGIDITERKQAEETQAKLAAIVETSNDAIIGRALDGTVTSWNAAAERILGYTAAETIGRDPVEIFPPRLQQQIAEYRKLVRAGQMVPNHETVHIAKDGRHIDFAVSLSAIKDNSGRIIGTATTLRDITERKRTEQALHNYARRLRGVSRRLFAVEETERRNINRELHDRIGQTLAALNMNLNIIRSQLPQQSLDAVGARLQDTQTLLEETAAQIRNIMADLHPPALDDYGLLAALRVYAESFGARCAVPITAHGEDLAPRLPLVAETALFRVAQGALANAAAHARATRVQVLLAATPDRVTLTIADDGAGFDVAHAALAHASWGLAIMRERAEAVGATLRIDTAPGRGTRVVVEIEREAA